MLIKKFCKQSRLIRCTRCGRKTCWENCAAVRIPILWAPFTRGNVFEQIIAFARKPWIMAGGQVK